MSIAIRKSPDLQALSVWNERLWSGESFRLFSLIAARAKSEKFGNFVGVKRG